MTQLYDRIGSGYDVTRRPDPIIAGRLSHHVALEGHRTYLDIGCGTGNYTSTLAAVGGGWTGIELSAKMIAEARGKSSQVQWCLCAAQALPFSSRVFSGAMCTLAIHHFDDLLPVFREVHRVLDKGKFVILTATPEQMQSYWLNEYFPEAMRKSIEQMPALELVTGALTQAGFTSLETEGFDIRNDLQDFFLYSGKHRPEMYLDEGVRRGISTFASLADPAEVAGGSRRLPAPGCGHPIGAHR
jgi:SAM-dependent methyltransferase